MLHPKSVFDMRLTPANLRFVSIRLIAKDRVEEAEIILADIEGTEKEDPYVQTELGEIKFANQYEKEHAVRIRDLVRGRVSENDPCTLRRILLGMGKTKSCSFIRSWYY